MFTEVHRRLRQEEGISLVEVLVSIVLMGLVLAALGSTLFSSMASARQNEGLTQATALANERVERLRTRAWSGLVAGTTVDAAVPREGRTYRVTTVIETPHANLRRYRVDLLWTENNRQETLRLEGRRARRPGEGSTADFQNPFRVVLFNVNPDPVLLDTMGRTLPGTFTPAQPPGTAMVFDVELNDAAAAGTVVVTWPIPSPTQSLTLTEVAGSGGKKWTGRLASGQVYPAGWMTFRVAATKAVAPILSTSGNTAAYLQAPIQNGPLYYDDKDMRLYKGTPGPKHPSDPTLSGDRLCLNASTGRLRNSNPFYLGLRGLGLDDTVILRRIDGPPVEFTMTWTRVQTTWWWVTDVSAVDAGAFTPGTNSNWEIQWIRSYDNLSATIPYTFHIQNADGNSPC